jgi:hypothetical protein
MFAFHYLSWEMYNRRQNLIAFGGFIYYNSLVFLSIVWKQEHEKKHQRSLILVFNFLIRVDLESPDSWSPAIGTKGPLWLLSFFVFLTFVQMGFFSFFFFTIFIYVLATSNKANIL